MSRVFVVQEQYRYDRTIGQLVMRHDLSAAKKFGKLCFLLNDRNTNDRPETVVRKLCTMLQDYSDEDYLLLIGNPAFIAWAATIASICNEGRLKMLVWSGEQHDYKVVESRVPLTF